jgi:transcriptional regulator with XRE-family HTH domain
MSRRHSYLAEGVKTWIARQVRSLREQRGWSQSDLSIKIDKPQSAISRIEDPDYGKMSLQTLFDLAKAFDVALIVKFVDYPTFLRETDDQKTASLHVESFDPRAFSSDMSPNKISITMSGEDPDHQFIMVRGYGNGDTSPLAYLNFGAAQNHDFLIAGAAGHA